MASQWTFGRWVSSPTSCSVVRPSPGLPTRKLTCRTGYTPFDRDTQQQEMEAIIAGDYHFEPGTSPSPPTLTQCTHPLTPPSRAAHRGVLGERVGHGEELRDRVPHDRPRVAPDGRGGAPAQVARVRGAALRAEPVRRADEPAPADPEGVRRAQDLYVPCPALALVARAVC